MQLSISDQTRFPRFTQYVRHAIPKLITVPKIVRNMATYGALTQLEFKEAISWGKGPNVIIKNLHGGQCGVPQAYGCFDPARPANIEIHVGTVNDFETHSASHINSKRAGQVIYVAGATLLHELCHWGNHNNIPPIPEVMEMGETFELQTYGKIIY